MEKFVFLLKRKLLGKANLHEEEALNAFLKQDQELAFLFELLTTKKIDQPTAESMETELAYKKHLLRIK